ncbi:hypothetical protein BJL95_00785 [Methylomonas sp. LWB]|nr:hypothetical protein BJL95_00785 [Methylomonas sp. LWB]
MLVESVADAPPDNLYLSRAKDIDKMRTVTYYITQSTPNRKLLYAFKGYAEQIGDTNGAVIINIKDKFVIQNKDRQYYEYLNNTKCNFPTRIDELPTLIYESKKHNQCFIFKRLDEAEFDATIIKLLNERADLNGLKMLDLKSRLQHIVEDAVKSNETLKGNELVFRDFIDFIIN